MNAIVRNVLEGEVLAPGLTVRVVGTAHPLRGSRIDRQVAAGLSISEILQTVLSDYPELRARRDFIVHLDGHPIPERNWRARVKPGVTMTFWPRLHGGNAMKVVLGLVVAVAAFVFAGPIAAGMGLSIAGFALTGTALSIATAVVAGGIMLAGTLALNALYPVAPAAVSDNSSAGLLGGGSLNSIQGARNQANGFGAIPVVLGTHRQSPYFAAQPYTEIEGDDQYLRLLFCLGYGPLDISDLRIGETPIGSFQGVTIEQRQGYVSDPAITIYPNQVHELALSITLNNPNGQPGVVDDNGYWQSQTTEPGTDWIQADWTAPEGVYAINAKTGNPDNWTVYIQTRYRQVGDITWVNPGDIVFTRSTVPARRGITLQVPRGQYEFQTRKHSGDADPSKQRDKIVWTALRSINSASAIAFPKPLAMVALRIRATDQLSGTIDTFNCVTTSRVTAWNGSAWIADTASQWPPDLFRAVLQGPANARPVPDAQIDLPSLQAWWTYCVANGFKFNQVINSVGSVYAKLCDIAAAGRGKPTWIDGKWGVVWDRPADPIVQHFTPRNSWGFQGQKPYAQQPHGWRVAFINQNNGYTEDERIVYDDGYNASNATLFEGLQFPGVTDPDLIWRHGRFQIAQARLRPEKITLSAAWENLICTSGDRVAVTHDVLLIGLNSGRVKSVASQVVTFDETVTIAAGKTYAMSFRLAALTSPIVRAVDPATIAGDYNSLTLIGDVTGVAAELGCLFAFGETGQQYAIYRVQSKAHQKDMIGTLTLVDDAQAISTADQGTIPAYNPNITIPPDPFTLPPRDLQYHELIDGSGASVRALLALTWQVPRFGKIVSFQVQQRDDNVGGPWTNVASVLPPETSAQIPLISAGVWSFRVRCLFTDGTASSWLTLDHLSLQGLSAAPGAVSNLRNTFINGREFLSWDNPTDVRLVPIEIRKGASFLTAQIIIDRATSPWQTVGDDLYWVTSYVLTPFGARVYSTPAQSILIVDSVAVQNIVVSHDERAQNWTGTFEGSIGIDQDDNFLRTAGAGDDFLGRADFLAAISFLDGNGLEGGGYYWSKTTVNIGGVGFCRISNDWTAIGLNLSDDFLGRADFLGNLDFLGDSLTQYVRVRPVVKISQVGPVPVFGGAQVWSPDVYEGWVFWLGIQFEILTDVVPNPGVVAYLLNWVWTIDVPDRLDSYQNLTVPSGPGLAITFRPTGGAVDVPFNGGLNNEALPHLTPSIQNPNAGDQVVWSSLSLAGATLKVMNAGSSVGGSQVNVLVRGY